MSTARPVAVPPGMWRLALAAGLASYLDAAILISVSISLAIWRDHYRLSLLEVGVLTAGLSLAVAAGSLVGGWLGDRFGRGRVFSYVLGVFVAGTVGIITAVDGAMLIGAVIVVGLAAGADVPTSLAVIADAAPEGTRGRVVALTQVLWIAGILVTFLIGFAVSTLGFLGTKILVGHLVLLAVGTLALRLTLVARARRSGAPVEVPDTRGSLRRLAAAGVVGPLVATGVFFVFWNVASTTLGNYGTYYLITRTGLTQTEATGLVLLTFPPALVLALVFTRLADSAWRDRLFVVAMLVQIAAFGLGAVTGGVAIWGMVGLTVLYSLSNVFAGEAAYKVWSQLLFPAHVRSTAVGTTYALARAVAAGFMLLVPALIAGAPEVVLWILTGCVVVSGLTGLLITRHPALIRSLPAAGVSR